MVVPEQFATSGIGSKDYFTYVRFLLRGISRRMELPASLVLTYLLSIDRCLSVSAVKFALIHAFGGKRRRKKKMKADIELQPTLKDAASNDVRKAGWQE